MNGKKTLMWSLVLVLLLAMSLCAFGCGCNEFKAEENGSDEKTDTSFSVEDVVARFGNSGYRLGCAIYTATLTPADRSELWGVEGDGEVFGFSASKGEERFLAWIFEDDEQASAASDDYFDYYREIEGEVCDVCGKWVYRGTEAAVNIFLNIDNSEEITLPSALEAAVRSILRAKYNILLLEPYGAERYSLEVSDVWHPSEGQDDWFAADFFSNTEDAKDYLEEYRSAFADTCKAYPGWVRYGLTGNCVYIGTDNALKLLQEKQ